MADVGSDVLATAPLRRLSDAVGVYQVTHQPLPSVCFSLTHTHTHTHTYTQTDLPLLHTNTLTHRRTHTHTYAQTDTLPHTCNTANKMST